MKHILIIFFMVVALPSWLKAQVVNIENKRLDDGTYGFSGSIGLSFSAQKNTTPFFTFDFKPIVQYKFNGKKHRQALADTTKKDSVSLNSKTKDRYRNLILLYNDFNFAGTKGQRFSNSGLSHLRYAYRINQSIWEWESYTQIEYNELLLRKMRYLLGTGIRVNIMDIKQKRKGFADFAARFYLGSSFAYEYEDINYSDRPDQYINIPRWSTYLSSYFNFKYFEIATTTYIQPDLFNFKNARLSGDYSILFRVSNPFSIRFTLSHFYDTKPPISVPKGTYNLSVGFTYKLDKFKVDKDKISKFTTKLKNANKSEKEEIKPETKPETAPEKDPEGTIEIED